MKVICFPWIDCFKANSQASLSQRFLWVLVWHCLVSLLRAVCRKGWVFEPLWDCSFYNGSRNPGSPVVSFLVLVNPSLPRNVWIFRACGENSPEEMVLPTKSACLTPKWHFSIVSLNPVWRWLLKTALMFRVSFIALLTAVPMSFTYWAHWSALTTESNYSSMKPENADTDLLRPCPRLF